MTAWLSATHPFIHPYNWPSIHLSTHPSTQPWTIMLPSAQIAPYQCCINILQMQNVGTFFSSLGEEDQHSKKTPNLGFWQLAFIGAFIRLYVSVCSFDLCLSGGKTGGILPFFLSGGSSGNLNGEVHISEIERYTLATAGLSPVVMTSCTVYHPLHCFIPALKRGNYFFV